MAIADKMEQLREKRGDSYFEVTDRSTLLDQRTKELETFDPLSYVGGEAKIEERSTSTVEEAKRLMQETERRAAIGLGESAVSMATGIKSFEFSGFAGLLELMPKHIDPVTGMPMPGAPIDERTFDQKLDDAGTAIQSAQETFTYQPRTPEGQIAVEENPLVKTFEKLGHIGENIGGFVLKKTDSPSAAALAASLPEGLAVLAPFVKKPVMVRIKTFRNSRYFKSLTDTERAAVAMSVEDLKKTVNPKTGEPYTEVEAFNTILDAAKKFDKEAPKKPTPEETQAAKTEAHKEILTRPERIAEEPPVYPPMTDLAELQRAQQALKKQGRLEEAALVKNRIEELKALKHEKPKPKATEVKPDATKKVENAATEQGLALTEAEKKSLAKAKDRVKLLYDKQVQQKDVRRPAVIGLDKDGRLQMASSDRTLKPFNLSGLEKGGAQARQFALGLVNAERKAKEMGLRPTGGKKKFLTGIDIDGKFVSATKIKKDLDLGKTAKEAEVSRIAEEKAAVAIEGQPGKIKPKGEGFVVEVAGTELTNKKGKPFATEASAKAAAKRQGVNTPESIKLNKPQREFAKTFAEEKHIQKVARQMSKKYPGINPSDIESFIDFELVRAASKLTAKDFKNPGKARGKIKSSLKNSWKNFLKERQPIINLPRREAKARIESGFFSEESLDQLVGEGKPLEEVVKPTEPISVEVGKSTKVEEAAPKIKKVSVEEYQKQKAAERKAAEAREREAVKKTKQVAEKAKAKKPAEKLTEKEKRAAEVKRAAAERKAVTFERKKPAKAKPKKVTEVPSDVKQAFQDRVDMLESMAERGADSPTDVQKAKELIREVRSYKGWGLISEAAEKAAKRIAVAFERKKPAKAEPKTKAPVAQSKHHDVVQAESGFGVVHRDTGKIIDVFTDKNNAVEAAIKADRAIGSTGGATLYSGIPMDLIGRKLLDPVMSAWAKVVDKGWAKLAKPVRELIMKSDKATDVVGFFVEDFGLTRAYKELRRRMEIENHRWNLVADEHAKAIREIDGHFKTATRKIDVKPETLEKRAKQIAGGSITAFEEKFAGVRKATERFQRLEKMLTERGLLKNHQFKNLTRRERAKYMKTLERIDRRMNAMVDQFAEIKKSGKKDLETKALTEKFTTLNKRRVELVTRLQIHYMNSGRTYFRLIHDRLQKNANINRVKKMKLDRRYALRRDNFDISLKDDGTVVVKRKGNILKNKSVKDLEFLVRKGISEEARDVHMYDLFNRISKSKRWVKKSKAEGFKKLPKDAKKYGPLSGKYVDVAVHRELSQMTKLETWYERLAEKGFARWKAGKTVWSPKTQVRNFISNTVLADVIADVPITDVGAYVNGFQVMIDIKRGKKVSGYAKEIKFDTLISRTSFTEQELRRVGKFLKLEDWGKKLDRSKLTRLKKRREVARKAKNTELVDRLTKEIDNLGPMNPIFEVMGRLIERGLEKPGQLYGLIEEGMKATVYIKWRERGLSPRKAEAIAQKALFDYSRVPPAIRWARKGYSPFATFVYKATPALAANFVKRPHKLFKYYAMVYGIERLSRAFLGESQEVFDQERAVLPEYAQRDMLPGMPTHVRLPYRDEDGRAKYFDLSFILPWGELTEGQGDFGIGFRAILPNNPLWNYWMDIRANEDIFLEKPLAFKFEDGGEVMLKFMAHGWKTLAPGILDPNNIKKITRAVYGDKNMRSQKYSVGEAVADAILGIKIRSIDYVTELGWRHTELQDEIYEIRQWFAQEYNNLFWKQAERYTDKEREEKFEKIYKRYNDELEDVQDKLFKALNEEVEKE